jgi:hypothetical protein
LEHKRVEVTDGQITISGIMGVLNAAGVKVSRRTLHYFVANRNYPTKLIGTCLLVPQRVVSDFITDWHSRHSD